MPALCVTMEQPSIPDASGNVSAAEELRALCIIRDMTNTQWQCSKVTLNLPGSTTGQQMLEEVSKSCHYQLNTFELVLQRVNGDSVLINDHIKYTLAEIGFRCGESRRNNLIVGEKNGEAPVRIESSGGQGERNCVFLENLASAASGDSGSASAADGASAQPHPASGSSYSPMTDYSCSYSSPLIKQETGYVGLVNQAMTCYLNSLLQTLYMTPEFRNALYRWEFDGTEEEKSKSIPYQLQRLFLLLQTSKRHAIETTELTRSFGWDSSEAWQQHDVQELCRVMFDALEHKFRNTDQADLINRNYQGKIKDYVKCLECSHESAREDTYLDIPLPVRPFGSNRAYGSVEEALQAFVQPEVLNGSNQYFCERCDRKCDAHKGLKFITFPYLLTLQLKRFDFDYTTMHRIKLNDKVKFQEILNLNCFIKCEHDENGDDAASTTDSGSALDDDGVGTATPQPQLQLPVNHLQSSGHDDDDDADEGIEMEPGQGADSGHSNQETTANEKNLQHSMEKGPYLYELFSIMVHSGSANGGHYYAYIKSFSDGHWYCFNDQSVSRITYDDIRKTYGGGPTRSYYSGAYSSSTNAYMLMYRQIDKERNVATASADEFPAHIASVLQGMQQQEERDRQQREMERNMCKIKLFWNNNILHRVSETVLRVHKDTTLTDLTKTAHSLLGLEGLVPIERCRLVKYDDIHDSLECSFEGSENVGIGELLGGAKSTYRYSLLLEVWPPDKVVPVYKPGGTTVKVYAVNLDTEEVESPVTVRSYLAQSVDEFKLQVVQELGLINCDAQLVLERYYNDLRPLKNGSKSLKSEGFYRSSKVFVERCNNAETSQSENEATFNRILDRYEHTISLNVVLPDLESETSGHLMRMFNHCNGDAAPSADDEGIGEGEESADSHRHHNGALPLSLAKSTAPPGSSDQSEDSSLTDSERTIVGDSSPPDHDDPLGHDDFLRRLETVQCFAGAAAASGAGATAAVDGSTPSSDSGASPRESGDLDRNVSSPEENYTGIICSEDWDSEAKEMAEVKSDVKRYFRATKYTDPLTDGKKLRVHVDKRITLGALKKELEESVGVEADSFKVYRIYSNNQEFECTRLSESLIAYSDDTQMVVKVGRALKKGEYRVKIFQLLIEESDPAKYLIDWIFAKGMSVLEAKQEILPEIKSRTGLDIPINRCRLRKKSWRTPSTIYIDSQRFEDDISVFDNSEVYLEVLSGPELVTVSSQLSLYARHWHPATFILDPMREVVLNDCSVEQLKEKLCEISEIPPEFIDFSKIQGSFPCDVNVLSLHTDLDWNPQVTHLNVWPMYICDDGFIVCFKDRREKLKQLSEEERRQIITKESARIHKLGRGVHSPRKEKALKIYTDSPPSKSEMVAAAARVEPDLD